VSSESSVNAAQEANSPDIEKVTKYPTIMGSVTKATVQGWIRNQYAVKKCIRVIFIPQLTLGLTPSENNPNILPLW